MNSEVYSQNSSKTMGNFPEVLNFNSLFLKLNWFICNYQVVLPIHFVPTKWTKHTNDVCFIALNISDKVIEFEKSMEQKNALE